MAKKAFSLRCEEAVAENKGFSVQENGEKHNVSVETAKEVLKFRKRLTPHAKVELEASPVKNQLEIAATEALFTEIVSKPNF